MSKIIALCSVPRLGYTDFAGNSIAAFGMNNIAFKNLFGVYWQQSLSEGIRDALNDGFDYIVTTDYDSIFDVETVAQLIRLADQNPHADAICAMQMGRFTGLLVSNDTGELLVKDLKENALVPVNTGHFGLTLFRAESFKDLPKPWFQAVPDEDGDWKRHGVGKRDADIYFWDNFRASGKQLYLAPRLVIGHLELLIQYPSDKLDGIYCKTNDFYEHGKPKDVWT
jgi:hypothetical protein